MVERLGNADRELCGLWFCDLHLRKDHPCGERQGPHVHIVKRVNPNRIARLVQLDIRQARYVGRTKTLFQLCLAAAVANLTLVAATSNALSMSGSEGLPWSLVILAALLSHSSLLLGFGLAAFVIRHSAHLDQLIHPMVPIIRPLTPTSRPGF